jgi:hypothetical protein
VPPIRGFFTRWLDNVPGRGQQRRSLKTKSKKQARKNGAKLADKITNGQTPEATPRRYTVGGVVAERRRTRLRELGRQPGTIEACERFDRQLMAFLTTGADTPIEKLSTATLEAFEQQLGTTGISAAKPDGRIAPPKSRPLAAKTLHEAMKSVRGLIQFALERGWLREDPAKAYSSARPKPGDHSVYFGRVGGALRRSGPRAGPSGGFSR